jgi:hypothetical protein
LAFWQAALAAAQAVDAGTIAQAHVGSPKKIQAAIQAARIAAVSIAIKADARARTMNLLSEFEI